VHQQLLLLAMLVFEEKVMEKQWIVVTRKVKLLLSKWKLTMTKILGILKHPLQVWRQ
jgi:hypothetical protein